ncbi:MAG: hypothetical protein FWF56_02455 [Firmicutes bacterium]|nr:hypothetical protein [Bacillota bacterium]MCL1953699.1 hypothetical protein [Bacillota bacterium]
MDSDEIIGDSDKVDVVIEFYKHIELSIFIVLGIVLLFLGMFMIIVTWIALPLFLILLIIFIVFLVVSKHSRYSYVFLQNDKRYYIKRITNRKYIYSDGKRMVCFKFYKIKNNPIEVQNSFKVGTNVKGKWKSKSELSGDDCIIRDFPESIRFYKEKYKVLSFLEKVLVWRTGSTKYHILEEYPIKTGILEVSNRDSDGVAHSARYTVKQYDASNFKSICNKGKSICSIIQTICEDTGMQMQSNN